MTVTQLNPRITMLNRLHSGKPVFGTFLMLSSAWTARIVAQAGWDYVFVDCEHGNIGDNDMHDSVNAIAACGVSPIVRVRGTDPTLIKRALDTGAHGLMIPMINTADQARGVVQAAKFPPMGVRGQGSPFSALAHGLSTPEYLQQANRDLLTIIQIESLEGVENVDEICKVPGVDAIFIGPNDLAMSILNYAPARHDEPPFLEALDRISTAAKRHGKFVGILVSDGVAAKKTAELYDIIAVGGDVKAISGWMGGHVKAAKAESLPSKRLDYEVLPLPKPDTMFELLARFDKDTDPRKVNLAPGAYRDDNGLIWLLPSVKAATAAIISLPTYEHQYLGIQGHVPFLRQAARLILGDVAVETGHIASLQTSGGTGACHTGAVFLKKFHDVGGDVDVFISNPSWENHHAVFQHADFVTRSYRCYNAKTRSLDFAGMKADVDTARRGSIFVLHVCAHNPTGCDPTDEQWDELSRIFKRKGLYAFLDCAYQGFATGDLVRDKYAVEAFLREGVDMVVAQSFSKIAGLYGERLGALHIPCRSEFAKVRVVEQLKAINRREVSVAPRFGADIMYHVLSDEALKSQWISEVKIMSDRLSDMRRRLVAELQRLNTSCNWEHITKQRGMFSYTGLTAEQSRYMTDECHAYMPPSGRLSVTGLTTSNVEYVARCMDHVVRHT